MPSPTANKFQASLQNFTANIAATNSLLAAGGNTLSAVSGITNTVTSFTKPQQPKNNNKDTTGKSGSMWLLLGGAGLLYLLIKK